LLVIGHGKGLRQLRADPFNFRIRQDETIVAVAAQSAVVGSIARQSRVIAVRRLDFKRLGRDLVVICEMLVGGADALV
jgi:hypothetical protein